ncbi:DUF1294 domain-containing protein [Pontibrevibacter nitratireducens]|uniref:DUF1294 domain-containing protein n=2 Tax=Pontivivens nitratireducens TaxID=2758038 RepID=A0A6G7VQ75_9RHOB|nr:DUF1294 domain-containing protein [Pontibrevibacter nitratireducens]
MNHWTYQGFAQDKARSLNGEWRIPEYALLRWTARGGAPAAYYARRTLRHKTRKEPFSSQLRRIAIRQAIWVPCVLTLVYWTNPVGLMREHEIVSKTIAAVMTETKEPALEVQKERPIVVWRRSE